MSTAGGATTGIVLNILGGDTGDLLAEEELFFFGDFFDFSASLLELFFFFLDEDDLVLEASPSIGFLLFLFFFLSDVLEEECLPSVGEDDRESLLLDDRLAFLLLRVASVVERQVETRSRISSSMFILEY